MSSSPQMAPTLKTIEVSLKIVGGHFRFELPSPPPTVYPKEQVQWRVNVSSVEDPSDVGVLVVFTKSNSKLRPHNWPFSGDNWWKKIEVKKDPDQDEFAIEFPQHLGEPPHTPPFQVPGKKSPKDHPVPYTYTLLASIPKGQIPRQQNILPNSNDSVDQWPHICMNGGNEYLIVRADPELYVEEC